MHNRQYQRDLPIRIPVGYRVRFRGEYSDLVATVGGPKPKQAFERAVAIANSSLRPINRTLTFT